MTDYRKQIHDFLVGLHPGGVTGIAKELGITRQTIYSWEKNGQIPDWHAPTLLKFCGTPEKERELSSWTSSAAKNDVNKRARRAARRGITPPGFKEEAPLTVQTFNFNRDGIGELSVTTRTVADDLEEPEDVKPDPGNSFPNPSQFDDDLGEPAAPPAPRAPMHQPRRW